MIKSNHKNKVLSIKGLQSIVSFQKSQNKKISFTNGCFDIIHIGHIRVLEKASGLSDKLIVGINSDRSIKKIKGKFRPIVPEQERAEVIASIQYVDYVVIFDELTPLNLIKIIEPDFLIKGGDWEERDIVGAEFVKSKGGKVISDIYIGNKSTTDIISKIKSSNER